jgi:hypothetical protein
MMHEQEQPKKTCRPTYKRDWETKPHRIRFTTSTRQADRIEAVIEEKGFSRNAFIRYAIDRYLAEVA